MCDKMDQASLRREASLEAGDDRKPSFWKREVKSLYDKYWFSSQRLLNMDVVSMSKDFKKR